MFKIFDMFANRKEERNKNKLKNEYIIPARLDENQKATILEEIDELVSGSWGKFDREFLKNHILKKTNGEIIIRWRFIN